MKINFIVALASIFVLNTGTSIKVKSNDNHTLYNEMAQTDVSIESEQFGKV